MRHTTFVALMAAALLVAFVACDNNGTDSSEADTVTGDIVTETVTPCDSKADNPNGCTTEPIDTDNDGVDDIFDDCPLVPEDFDGFEDFDGCPEDGTITEPPLCDTIPGFQPGESLECEGFGNITCLFEWDGDACTAGCPPNIWSGSDTLGFIEMICQPSN